MTLTQTRPLDPITGEVLREVARQIQTSKPEAPQPYGILYDRNPNLSYEWFAANYEVPTIEELKASKGKHATDKTGSQWVPHHHCEWITAVRRATDAFGYKVIDEQFSTSDDGHDLYALFEIEEEPQLSAGQLDLTPIESGITRVFGLKTSNMQRCKALGLAGARVALCSNGIATGQFVLGAKQTTNMNPSRLVYEGFTNWISGQRKMDRDIAAMRTTKITPSGLQQILAECVGLNPRIDRLFSTSMAIKVRDEFNEPRHPEFEERNAFNLYQATTEMIKHEKRGVMNNDKAREIQLGMNEALSRYRVRYPECRMN